MNQLQKSECRILRELEKGLSQESTVPIELYILF